MTCPPALAVRKTVAPQLDGIGRQFDIPLPTIVPHLLFMIPLRHGYGRCAVCAEIMLDRLDSGWAGVTWEDIANLEVAVCRAELMWASAFLP